LRRREAGVGILFCSTKQFREINFALTRIVQESFLFRLASFSQGEAENATPPKSKKMMMLRISPPSKGLSEFAECFLRYHKIYLSPKGHCWAPVYHVIDPAIGVGIAIGIEFLEEQSDMPVGANALKADTDSDTDPE
jgi:hypothetical protein